MKQICSPRHKHRSSSNRHMTVQEFNLIIDAITYEKHKIIFLVMGFVGLRSCEAVCIQRQDFNEDYTKLTVRLAKSDRVITRIIPSWLGRKIKNYVENNQEKFIDGYIFYPSHDRRWKNDNKHIQTGSLRSILQQARNRTGLKDTVETVEKNNGTRQTIYRIGTHSFRRFFITNVYRMTKDPFLTQQIIGHCKIETTQAYIAPFGQGREAEVANNICKSITGEESAIPEQKEVYQEIEQESDPDMNSKFNPFKEEVILNQYLHDKIEKLYDGGLSPYDKGKWLYLVKKNAEDLLGKELNDYALECMVGYDRRRISEYIDFFMIAKHNPQFKHMFEAVRKSKKIINMDIRLAFLNREYEKDKRN